MGSDGVGPMGKALLLLAGREAAQRFRHHHGSRLLQAGDTTPELLRELTWKLAEQAKP